MRRVVDVLTALLYLSAAVVGAVIFQGARLSGYFDPAPPTAWRSAAHEGDWLTIPGRTIAYWGKPDARYSHYATRSKKPPVAIVVHFTYPKRPADIVKYGHRRDFNRGGGSFGYHFYISSSGRIYQGAPLSRRTNHIKFRTRKQRTDIGKHLWSGNTIGISMVGGCNPMLAPVPRNPWACAHETVTGAQVAAALAVIKQLRTRFKIDCRAIYGHGDLQTDRQAHEGATVKAAALATCDAETAAKAGSDTSG